MDIKRTERGWAGHFICGHRCLFRRNTLLEYNDLSIVVSTVGYMLIIDGREKNIEKIGHNRYFETMCFHSMKDDVRYKDADVQRQIDFNSPWSIDIIDADDKANDMHETVVAEITERLLNGETF